MWLMICSEQDPSALWAYHGLQARGLRPFQLVTAEMLAQDAKWEHSVGVNGAYINITLQTVGLSITEWCAAWSTA